MDAREENGISSNGRTVSRKISPTPENDPLVQALQSTKNEILAVIMLDVAKQMSAQAYLRYMFEGNRGASPLVRLSRNDVELIASVFLVRLVSDTDHEPIAGKLRMVHSLDPNEMTAYDVAAVLCFAWQFRTSAFGKALADLAGKRPQLTRILLGPEGADFALTTLHKCSTQAA